MKHKPFYLNIFKQAWHHTWRGKYLWLFGFFAAFLGTSSVIEIVWRGLKQINITEGFWLKTIQGTVPAADALANYIKQTSLLETERIVATITGLILAALVIFITATLSQAAVIRGLNNRIQNKRRLGFWALVDSSGHSFWRLAGLNIFAKLLMILTIFGSSMFLAISVSGQPLADAVVYFITFILTALAALIISIILMYGTMGIVIKDHTWRQSIIEAWNLFKDNSLVSFEISVLVFLVHLIASLIMLMIILAAATVYILLFVLALYSANFAILTLVYMIGITIGLFLIFIYGAMVTTYEFSVWIILFDKLIAPKHRLMAKLHHFGTLLGKKN